MSAKWTRNTVRGFTLIEMMIVLVIAGIMLGIGVPAMRDIMFKSRMTSTLNDFVVAIQTTRTEAVKNVRAAVLCQSAAGTACDGTSWGDGWIVWVDHDGDGNVDASGVDLDGDSVIETEEIVAKGTSIDGVTFVADGDGATTDLHTDAAISFRPDGTSDITPPGVLKMCIDKAVAGLITIEATGRPTAERLDSGASCP